MSYESTEETIIKVIDNSHVREGFKAYNLF